MKFWPFGNHLERRESAYSDAVLAALLSKSDGKALAIPSATAALESCAGLAGRGFAAAEVSGADFATRALTPSIMEMVGRSLIRVGELVLLISTTDGELRLLPTEAHDIEGGPDPSTWTYRLTLNGPSRTLTHDDVPAQSVLHFKYGVDPARPYAGRGPIQIANLAGKLSAETARALGEESSGPIGRLLGVPVDGDDATVKGLTDDILNAKGRVALLETGDWNNSGGDTRVSLRSERFGAEPPSALVELLDASTKEVYAACGFNAALWGGGQAAAVREAWRLALFSVLAPLGKIVQSELQDKLDSSVEIGWQELRASDLQGRSRSVMSLVGAGIPVQAAAKEAGLMVDFQAEPRPVAEGD